MDWNPEVMQTVFVHLTDVPDARMFGGIVRYGTITELRFDALRSVLLIVLDDNRPPIPFDLIRAVTVHELPPAAVRK